MAKVKKTEKKAPPRRIPVGPRLVAVLKVAYRAKRPVLLEGSTGVGKSEIVHQAAEALGVQCTILDLSLLEPPDLVGLPVIKDGRTTYAPPQLLPLGGEGILLLEELNRAERYIQQPALQLLTARRLHEYVLPDGWSVVAAINPEEGEYQVTPLDPALRSRFLCLNVSADRRCWLTWAEAHDIHPAVLRLARNHDEFLDHVPPRTWTFVSEVLRATQPEEMVRTVLLRDLLGGYLPSPLVHLLLAELRQSRADLEFDVRGMLATYHTDGALQDTVRALRNDGQTDRLNQIARQLESLLGGPELNELLGCGQFSLDALEALLAELPGDCRERLEGRLSENVMVSQLLDVQPADILHGGYSGGPMSQRVSEWTRDPGKRHRVGLLAAAVCHHLGKTPDMAQLRTRTGPRIGLGHFLEQIGPSRCKELEAALAKSDLQPILPKSAKRRPR